MSAMVQNIPIHPTLNKIYQIVSTVGANILANPCARLNCGKKDCFVHSTGWKETIFPDLESCLTGPTVEAFFGQSEFMLDFVLLEAKRDNTTGLPKDVARALLGLEMEWNVSVDDAGIEKDFNKLLCFNAPLKAFIYSCSYRSRSQFEQSIFSKLRHFAQSNTGREEQYLILEYFKPRGGPGRSVGRPIMIEKGSAAAGACLK